jgi:hypothetical protein
MLIATHSAGNLLNAEPSDILHIRSGAHGGRYLVEESQKVGLLAGPGSDYAPRMDRAKRTKRVLFVEGRTDPAILKILAERLGIAWPKQWVVWTSARGHPAGIHGNRRGDGSRSPCSLSPRCGRPSAGPPRARLGRTAGVPASSTKCMHCIGRFGTFGSAGGRDKRRGSRLRERSTASSGSARIRRSKHACRRCRRYRFLQAAASD